MALPVLSLKQANVSAIIGRITGPALYSDDKDTMSLKTKKPTNQQKNPNPENASSPDC